MQEDLAPRRPLSGAPLDELPGGVYPRWQPLAGRTATLEPLDPSLHAGELYELSHGAASSPAIWDYLPYGPFESRESFTSYLRGCASAADPLFFAIREHGSGVASGVASYLNIHPPQGTIEIGHIWFAPALQRTIAATEAIFLMMRYAMSELRYRRLEWKCNALNDASRRAANRFGFRFEGIFYNAAIVKGANRDTAWYSIIDSEWPAVEAGFERWLDPANFDADGRQRRSLSECRGGS